MIYLVGVLTFVLVAVCAALILLVLVQLPKKDAGAGLAFGGGAADALFGAGSGNALTKITKWASGVFLVLAVLLGMLENRLHTGSASEFERALQQKQNQSPALAPAPAPAPSQSQPAPTTPSDNGLLTFPTATNSAPAATGT
ncbi:MAG TPA: preprotein translocase subunit SecG, partial [Verrucomicrobiae bacterium]|nr:preprotein translocase subunit SecG [Verrucomicrobiae bacterium]